ncbi:transcriptional repressor NrdR [Ruminococcaceae bacterium YRB3002]|nr:transcriptional repressor NrdR [Ruminococcaceae bacterium YRB3002]
MKCPKCGCEDSKVVDSRNADSLNAVRRRRVCEACGERFSTLERIEGLQPQVIKKDGTRQEFSRDKLLAGLNASCSKRPVSNKVLTDICNEVESMILAKPSREISTTEIGEYVMNRLMKIDKVAYVRFASVYKDFTDPTSFAHEVQSLKDDEE